MAWPANLVRAPGDGRAPVQFDLGREEGEEPGDVALTRRRQEGIDNAAGRRVGVGGGRAEPDPPAGPAGEHLGGGSAPAEDGRDRAERHLEDIMQYERDPLGRGEGVHHDVQGDADRIGEYGLRLGIGAEVARDGPQVRLQRLLAAGSAPAQHVQADPPGHGGEPAAQFLDAVTAGPGQAQPCLLHRVVGVRVRAEHPERDRAQVGAVGLEVGSQLVLVGHGTPGRVRRFSLPGRAARRRGNARADVTFAGPGTSWCGQHPLREEHMESRIQDRASQPDIGRGVQEIFKAIYSGGVPPQTLELVHLRASQINGCSACTNAGATNATKAGVSVEKLLALAAWYEDPRFDEAERAALALTEAMTRLADRPGAVTDEIWAEAAQHYDERQLGAVVLMVSISNFFNRINTTFRVPAGVRWD